MAQSFGRQLACSQDMADASIPLEDQDMAEEAEISVPLREWLRSDSSASSTGSQGQGSERNYHEAILSKLTVAYGIAEILKHLSSRREDAGSDATAPDPHETNYCTIDNFSVKMALGSQSDVKGVDMMHPRISAQITEPSFLTNAALGDGMNHEELGRFLEVLFNDCEPRENVQEGRLLVATSQNTIDESDALHSFGRVVYEVFSQIEVTDETLLGLNMHKGKSDDQQLCDDQQPAQKKRLIVPGADGVNVCVSQTTTPPPRYTSLQELGFPSSLSLLVQNCIDCGLEAGDRPSDAYDSVQTLCADLHLLLLEPSHFLFDRKCSPDIHGKIPLQIRKERMYGRETEVECIQEVGCSGGCVYPFPFKEANLG